MSTPVPEDLPALLDKMGLTLGRVKDDEAWALCPAHERRTGKPDSKPTNFSVNRLSGDAFCFACGYKANLEGLVRETLGLNTWEALGWLRENGASLTEYVERLRDFQESSSSGRTDGGGLSSDTGDPDLEFVLLDSPPQSKLEEKDISDEAVRNFKIKWSEGKWILPFVNMERRVEGWQIKGKSFVSNHPKGKVKKSHYLFGAHNFTPGDRAYLVESPLDAARLHTAGYLGGLATFGASVSKTQLSLLCSLTDDVVLVMDNDNAGQAATRWVVSALKKRVRRLHIATYEGVPTAKDPGDLTDLGVDVLLESTVSSLLFR